MTDNLLFKRLKESCVEFVAQSTLGYDEAVVLFTGEFEGQPVLWEARVVAIRNRQRGQYINVAETESADGLQAVEIGLQVSTINEPTVIMLMKMIRQFKNLKRGRHEFLGTDK